jgi:hypothetical protein
VKKPLIVVPTNVAQLTTVIEMKVIIRAYSIAVAPESSVRSAFIRDAFATGMLSILKLGTRGH